MYCTSYTHSHQLEKMRHHHIDPLHLALTAEQKMAQVELKIHNYKKKKKNQ